MNIFPAQVDMGSELVSHAMSQLIPSRCLQAKAMYAPPDDIDRWAESPEDGVEDVGGGLASGQVGGEASRSGETQ